MLDVIQSHPHCAGSISCVSMHVLENITSPLVNVGTSHPLSQNVKYQNASERASPVFHPHFKAFLPFRPLFVHFHALCRREGELMAMMVTAVRVCHILFGYILTSILGYNEELLIQPRRFAVRGCPLAYKTFNARLRST